MPSTTSSFLLVLCLGLSCGCGLRPMRGGPGPGPVTRVYYAEDSGPVPDRYAERYTITVDGIQFERAAAEGGPINRGVWEIDPAPGSVQALFDTLGAVDCRQIVRTGPDELPIGGGQRWYKIEYESGRTCHVGGWPEEYYKNASLITRPIRAFVRTIQLPAEAQQFWLDTLP